MKLNYELDIDFTVLKQQKLDLLSVLNSVENQTQIYNSLQGLLGVIDSIQDQAVDVHGYEEKEVFTLSDE